MEIDKTKGFMNPISLRLDTIAEKSSEKIYDRVRVGDICTHACILLCNRLLWFHFLHIVYAAIFMNVRF